MKPAYAIYEVIVMVALILQRNIQKHGAKNKFHLKKGGLYAFCTISIIIYTVIFMKGIFSIKPAYAISAVIVMVALILIGIYLTNKGGIRIETSIWQPSEEENNE